MDLIILEKIFQRSKKIFSDCSIRIIKNILRHYKIQGRLGKGYMVS